MSKQCYTVANIASEANLNVDDALLRLWDNKIECAENGTHIFSAKKLKQARRVLGIASGSDYSSPRFWQHKLGLNEADFLQLLNRLGVPFREGKRSLPKGSIKKLKNELRKKSDRDRAAELKKSHNNVVARQVIPEYHWEQVGDVREVRHLTTDQVRSIHYALVEDFAQQQDPISPPGVRNDVLLDAALHRAYTSLEGELKYPTVAMSCAAFVHSLVHDHPFHNGNKRTALVAMLVFLDENRLMLTCDGEELFRFILSVADHKIANQYHTYISDMEVMAIASWIHQNSRLVEKGDRAIPFRRLRQILQRFNCEINVCPGSCIKIIRNVRRRFPWSRKPNTKVHYDDEGREVEKNTINKIRRDLELDEEHGTDSRAFYEDADASVSEFIVTYRKTLSRLAKL